MEKWKTTNPAVALVNARLTNAGHDMGAEAANPRWYGGLPGKQRWAEQLAVALMPKTARKTGDLAERLWAEHLYWLGHKEGRGAGGWHWRYDRHEDLARSFGYGSTDPIKRATSLLKRAGLIHVEQRSLGSISNRPNHYRLTDEAHIVLAVLTLAGVGDLGRAQWLELLAPTEPGAKPLRDVLDGWQEVDSPEKLDALLEAATAAVVRVAGDTKAFPRLFNVEWNAALKAEYPEATPASLGTNGVMIKKIIKRLRAEADEPGAGFMVTAETLALFAKRVALGWSDLRDMVKAEKGEKLPASPSLEKLQFHVPVAIKLVFSPDPGPIGWNTKAGWDDEILADQGG